MKNNIFEYVKTYKYLFLSIMFILLIGIIVFTNKEEIQNDKPTIIDHIDTENYTDINNEEIILDTALVLDQSDNLYYLEYRTSEEVIDRLDFPSNIKIASIKEEADYYVAYGSKDNYPFFQNFSIKNKKIVFLDKQFIHSKKGFFKDFNKGYSYLNTLINDDGVEYAQDFLISNENFIPLYKKQIKYNYSKNLTLKPKYIVIHETNNTNVGADADAHYRYWNNNPSAYASTHYVVDNTQIYQMLELDQVAWHVGDNRGHSDITNLNSIGIEIAVNSDGNYEEARLHTIKLTIELMNELDMGIESLKRHYDASGKICPERMIEDPSLWDDFVTQVEMGLNQ